MKDIKPKYKKTKIVISRPIRNNRVRFDDKGISMWAKDSLQTPTGYCMSIELLRNKHLQIKTDGKYRFLNKAQTKKLIKILSDALHAVGDGGKK